MKRVISILIGIVALFIIILIGAGLYFYNYAVVPSEKDFLDDETPEASAEAIAEKTWFKDEKNRSYWEITSNDDLKLKAIYLPADEKAAKTAILAHGYMGNAETMSNFAKMYHDWGYNVLIPDARGHGQSAGEYIGFGWPERKDYVQWIDKVMKVNGQDEIITLFGLSMGAATVMMTSGEALPGNVKAIVEDCGYSSADAELAYQLKDMYGLPKFPLVPMTSLITKIRAGYFFGAASSVKQLQTNKTPMLFIHGDADKFVPFSMLETVYEATNGPKEKYIVPGAGHAKAYKTDKKKYQEKVSNFLNKYID